MNDSNVPHRNLLHIINDLTTRWNWNLNDILVFSSLMVFLLVVCSCTFMWITRPAPKKQIIDIQRQMEVADRIREVFKNGTTNSIESKKAKDKKKSKKKKKESLGIYICIYIYIYTFIYTLIHKYVYFYI
jgi:hypothetical protein